MIAYVNGRFVGDRNAAISIRDHGFLYGDGAYETIRVYNGEPFDLDAHVRRLARSARIIGLRLPWGAAYLARSAMTVLRRNRHRDAVLRIQFTSGRGPYGFDRAGCRPTLVISSTPLAAAAGGRRLGLKAAIVPIRRVDPAALSPTAKSMNALNGVLAKRAAVDLGADEAILLTGAGWVAEGSVSNVFVVTNGRVSTPPADGTILAGVVRRRVIALGRRTGLPVAERHLRIHDVWSADEIFITNAVMEVAPVLSLRIPPGVGHRAGTRRLAPGPITLRLQEAYRSAVERVLQRRRRPDTR